MSKDSLAKVVQRAISDAGFRRQLSKDPAGALRGFKLSADEMSAIRTGDAGRLSALGIDQRMSKAFVLGGALGATRLSGSDLPSSGATLDDGMGSGVHTMIPADPNSSATADASGDTASSGTAINDDPDGFLAARDADATAGTAASGSAINDDPDGFLAARDADAAAGTAASGTAINDDPDGFLAARDADATPGTAASGSAINDDPDGFLAARDADAGASTPTVHVGDDWKFASRVAPDSTSTVRTGDDWKFEAGHSAGADGMANYPAHDGLAGPSGVETVRAGDDWARAGGQVAADGTAAPLEGSPEATAADIASGSGTSASVIHDDPDGFLAANANAGGDVVRANVINDDPDGFLAANSNADVTGGSAATADAFIDESESYLTKVGYDSSQAASPEADTTWSGDDMAGPASVDDDAGGADGSSAVSDEPNLTS